MIFTGEEEKFKNKATEILKEKYPSVRFYYFQRKMYTERRGWFLGTLFSGYLFFQIEELTTDFFTELRAIKGFCRILRDNQNPTRITGSALEELKFLINNGEVLGVSKIRFFPNFDEGRCRVQSKNVQENLNMLHKFALNIIRIHKRESQSKLPLNGIMFRALMNPQALLPLLGKT